MKFATPALSLSVFDPAFSAGHCIYLAYGLLSGYYNAILSMANIHLCALTFLTPTFLNLHVWHEWLGGIKVMSVIKKYIG